MGEYLAYLNAAGLEAGHGHVTAERLAKLVALVADGTVSTSAGKEVFARMIEERAEPEQIVQEHGLGQISDAAELEAVVAAGGRGQRRAGRSSTATASSRCWASSWAR